MNLEKIERDVEFFLPNLDKVGRILVEDCIPNFSGANEKNECLHQENGELNDQLSQSRRNSSKPQSQGVDLKGMIHHIVLLKIGDCPVAGHNLRQNDFAEVIQSPIKNIPPILSEVSEY